MTIQLAKDQAAKEFGYESFEIAAITLATGFNKWRKLMSVSDRAMEIYAEAKAKEATSLDDTKIKYYEDKIEMLVRTSAELEKEAYNQGVMDAAESANTYGQNWKQSILKLLK